MKTVLLNSSIVGTKTGILLDELLSVLKNEITEQDQVEKIELKDYQIQFSDGRHYLDYEGDTGKVIQSIMDADVLIFGVPTYQASIPATLKNIFDLLPKAAFKNKTVSFVVTAGSDKHYLVMEYQLKPILSFMKANIVSNYVFAQDSDFASGSIANDDVRFRLTTLANDTLTLARSYQKVYEEFQSKFDF